MDFLGLTELLLSCWKDWQFTEDHQVVIKFYSISTDFTGFYRT